jgi:hypothetical protein
MVIAKIIKVIFFIYLLKESFFRFPGVKNIHLCDHNAQ